MKRLYGLVSVIMIISCANAQISVQGELSGFFLTSQGKLVWRTLSGNESNTDLQPLWGHYRLVLTICSRNQPIKFVEVTNSRKQKIWCQDFEPPRTICRIPDYPPSALRIHASDGFRFRLLITLADGSKAEKEWKSPILRPVHPFRIDWLSVAAATEALRLLRVYGRELFPQLLQTPIAWCFRGENGQLFVNLPNSPKGSHQVNLPLLPGVPSFWLPEKQRPFFEPGTIGGMTTLINGKYTCIIHYTPVWANRDPGAFRIDTFNATMWVYLALHEALHAVSLSTFNALEEQTANKAFKLIPPDKWVDWLVAQWMELEALKQAIDAADNAKEVEETKEMREAVEKGFAKITPPPTSWSKSKEEWMKLSQRWAWAFLQFREKRRALYGSNRRWLTRSEQVVEWTENIAHWGAVQLIAKAERERMSPLLSADPTAANYPDDEFESWVDNFSEINPNELALELVTSYGVGKLLSYWDANWLQKAAKGRMLEDLLAEVTGYTFISSEERNEAIDEVASEVFASAYKVRQELRQVFASAKGKPCLIVCGELPDQLSLEWSEGDEADGRLKVIVLKWRDGSSLKIGRNGKIAFQERDQIAVYAPVNKPLRVMRYRNQFLAHIGESVSFRWLPESKFLSVKVLGERWLFKDGKAKPSWLPPEGWIAVQVGKSWLWLKAAVRGGLQFLQEGGKRWNETPMTALSTQPVTVSPNFALTTEAPSDLVFVVRAIDKSLKVRSLSLKIRPLTVNFQPPEEGDEVIAQAKSSKGARELRLVLPFKLRWQVERNEDRAGNLIWFARFGDKEIRWLLGAVLIEVEVRLANGEIVEFPFLSGVLHPLLQGVEVKARQEMPGDLFKPTFSPAIGARCRVYLYRDKFDPEKAQCIAEGVTDETGKALLLIHAFNPDKVGLTASVLVEHENMGCRRLEWLGLWAFQHNVFFGSIISVNSLLAPHQVTFTLEIEGTRQLVKFERQNGEWRMFKEREEPITKVRVVVERQENFDALCQTIFDGEVERQLTLTVPTLGHDFEFQHIEPNARLRIRVIDPVTDRDQVLDFYIGAHGLYYYEGEKVLQLVGKINPPIKVEFLVTDTVTVTSSNPTR